MWFTAAGADKAFNYRFLNRNLLQNQYDETDFSVNKNNMENSKRKQALEKIRSYHEIWAMNCPDLYLI
jgi:hypothetical protein